jgi:D-3-phosphoglycerate dehydrogenase
VTAALDVAAQVLAALRGEPVKYAVNAPTLPPEVAAALVPYVDLAEKLGQLFNQLSHPGDGQMGTVEIVYNGDIADLNTTTVKASLLKGLLQAVVEDPVNLVNSLHLAKMRGLQVIEEKNSETLENFTNVVTLRVPGAKGISELSGTVVRGQPHIVRINHHSVDVVPGNGHLLFTVHDDRPGVIGKVATLFGSAGINISFIQASRAEQSGDQIMVLGVDGFVSDQVFRQVLQLSEIRMARLARI